MAINCNTGYSELVKKGVGEASDAFTYVAIGTGTGQTATSTTLAAETVVSGLARAAATSTSETTTVTDDTMQWVKTWTNGGATTVITEFGVFNNAVKDAGDMMMYAELSPSASLPITSTLTITAKTQIKAD